MSTVVEQWPRMLRLSAVRCLTGVGLLLLASGCRNNDFESCAGAEKCECYPNDTCDEGLECLSSRCVRPDNGDNGDEGDGGDDDRNADDNASDDDPVDDDPHDSSNADDAPDEDDEDDDLAADEGPHADDPPTDEAVSDEGATDEQAADEASADEASADEAKTDEPPTNAAASDEATPDDPVTDEGAADEATTDEAAPDDSAVDEGAPDEPATDESATDDDLEPVSSDLPVVMIVADQSASMFNRTTTAGDAIGDWENYPNRWEALRATVSGLQQWDDQILFAALTYYGDVMGVCPLIVNTTSPADGLSSVLDILPPTELADDGRKRESPTAAALQIAVEQLQAIAPTNPRFIVLITKGTPDTCAVPDPQCGGDPAVAVIQNAYANGIRTLVVAMEDEDDGVANDMAHAGLGNTVEPLDPATELYCIDRERIATLGQRDFDYDDWRLYTEASYGPDGYTYSDTAYYDAEDAALFEALDRIAHGTF